jgi:hypothetical protein
VRVREIERTRTRPRRLRLLMRFRRLRRLRRDLGFAFGQPLQGSWGRGRRPQQQGSGIDGSRLQAEHSDMRHGRGAPP